MKRSCFGTATIRQVPVKACTVLLILLSLFPTAWARPSDGNIAIIPAKYNLGRVGHEDRILGTAQIANHGQKLLTIRSVRSNCACYKVVCPPRELLPGESATVEFDLTFLRGRRLHNPVIYVLTDDKEKPRRTLVMRMSFVGEATPSTRQPGEILVELNGPEAVKGGSLEEFNREKGVVRVEERSNPGAGKRYALHFGPGADIEQTARAYLMRPDPLAFSGLSGRPFVFAIRPFLTKTARCREPCPFGVARLRSSCRAR